MEQKIWKYTFDFDDGDVNAYINIPEGADILSCQMRFSEIVIWVLVDTEQGYVKRHFRVKMTGGIVRDNEIFIATVQNEMYVYHIFEVI